MALRVEPMSNPSGRSSESPQALLLRRLGLLGLVMVAGSVGLAMLSQNIPAAAPIWIILLNDTLMGLAMGLAARRILRKYRGALRLASALSTMIGGMLLLGWLTGWQAGIGPLVLHRSNPDWSALGQFSVGMGVALLGLYAGPRPALSMGPAVGPPTLPTPPVKRAPRTKRPTVTGSSRSPRPKVAPPSPSRSRRSGQTTVGKTPVGSKRKRAYAHKPRLQVAGQEEHRCPYCLELVEPNDPRGTVECKICHALHHADCWAIAGACQVPHYNA
jgi:hypothetical protein